MQSRDLGIARLQPPYKNHNWLLITAIVYLLLALLLYLSGGGYHAGFFTVNQLETIIPSTSWQIITSLGDEQLLLSLVLLLSYRYSQCLRVIVWAAITGWLISMLMKLGCAGLRPPSVFSVGSFHLVGPAYHHHSFPSGHTQLAFAVAGSIAIFTQSWFNRTVALSLASLVGISRVAVGVHWPIDVLVGAAIGLTSAWIGLIITQSYSGGQNPDSHLSIMLILLIFPLRLIAGYDSGLEVVTIISPLIGMLVLSQLVQHYIVDHL